MSNKMTRRSFLAGSAGAIALAGVSGYVSFGAWQQAHAANYQNTGGERRCTLCDGCSNQCGMSIWINDERPLRAMGLTGHPYSRGKICGRGQGLITLPYSEDRLTEPLKKDKSGSFSQISWDQAFTEIAENLGSDSSKIAAIQGHGTDSYFVRRFMTAIGSPNYYTDGAFNNCDITAAVENISGAYPSPDIANANYVLSLDKSYYDGMRPAESADFETLRERGGNVVVVDPRLTSFSSMASEWVPCRPGSELALLLAIANQMILKGSYDRNFVNQHANGFQSFASEMGQYTPDWASDKTGIPADKIASIAADLINNAPRSLVEMSWAGAFGCGYQNSADTVRMLLLVNAMLGNTNQEGGMIYGRAPYISDSMLASAGISQLDQVSDSPVGSDAAPLSSGSSAVGAIRGMLSGDITGAILFETNPVQDFTDKDQVTQALNALDCLVVCDTMMTDTAQLADYVLPLTSYLERTDTIQTASGISSVAAVRHPVIDQIHPDTKTVAEIISGLADAEGVGDDFNFDVDDYNRACADLMNVSYDGLQSEAVSSIPNTNVTYGSTPTYRTSSGRLDFSSNAFQDAGLSAVPTWTEPKREASGDNLRLLIGSQAIHTNTFTSNVARLMQVSKTYGLDRLWINSDYAQSIGVSENDEVEVTSDIGSFRARAHVTSCIHPEAVWMAEHYGATSQDETAAYNVGVPVKSIVPLDSEPGTGAAMVQEAVVTVRKVGA